MGAVISYGPSRVPEVKVIGGGDYSAAEHHPVPCSLKWVQRDSSVRTLRPGWSRHPPYKEDVHVSGKRVSQELSRTSRNLSTRKP